MTTLSDLAQRLSRGLRLSDEESLLRARGFVPIVVMEDLSGIEDFVPFRRMSFWGGTSMGPGAAARTKAQVLNPAGSGVIAVITDVYAKADTASADVLPLIHTEAFLTMASTQAPLAKSGRGGARGAACQFRFETAAATAGWTSHIWPLTTAVVQVYQPKVPYVIEPGQAFSLQNDADNVGLDVVMMWDEIPDDSQV